MIVDILMVPIGLAGLKFVHPSDRTAGLEAVLCEFDAFRDPQLEALEIRLRRVLAEIASVESAFVSAWRASTRMGTA